MDHVTSAVVTVLCSDNGKISIELIRARSSIKAKTENEKPKIAIEVWVEGNVGDVQCTIDLSKTELKSLQFKNTPKEVFSKLNTLIISIILIDIGILASSKILLIPMLL